MWPQGWRTLGGDEVNSRRCALLKGLSHFPAQAMSGRVEMPAQQCPIFIFLKKLKIWIFFLNMKLQFLNVGNFC